MPIAANLRHHDVEPVFNEQDAGRGTARVSVPRRTEDPVASRQRLRRAAWQALGRPRVNDYNFSIDGDSADPENCRVEISERKRGSPLDKLVSELMIVANSTWGGLLAEKGVPAIYRAQTGGKVRMTTLPLPHDGLGVDQYAWSSPPLRRYVDLVINRGS